MEWILLYLNFNKAFDEVSDEILVEKMEKMDWDILTFLGYKTGSTTVPNNCTSMALHQAGGEC